jgi:hypothetical protein
MATFQSNINEPAGTTMAAADLLLARSASTGEKGYLTVADVRGDADAVTYTAGNTFSGANTFSSTNTFSGVNTFSAANIFSVMFRIPCATVAATGTVQGDAAAITTGFTLVTAADDAKGVILPAAAAGLVCIIKVDTGADLKVYPNTGDAINAIAANTAITVVDDVCFALIAYDATTWYTLPLLPS